MTDHLTDRESFFFEAARANQSRASLLQEENAALKQLLAKADGNLRTRVAELEAEVTKFKRLAEQVPKLEAKNLDLARACERLERSLGACMAAKEIFVVHKPIDVAPEEERGETP